MIDAGRLWWTRIAWLRVIDGDTHDYQVDRGLNSRYRRESLAITLRLLGVNCPEVHGATKAAGLAATEFSSQWLYDHSLHSDASPELSSRFSLYGHTVRAEDATDDFGRYLLDVVCGEGHVLADDLIASGNGVPLRRAVWDRKLRKLHSAVA